MKLLKALILGAMATLLISIVIAIVGFIIKYVAINCDPLYMFLFIIFLGVTVEIYGVMNA
mgnify:CR=1 FL=1